MSQYSQETPVSEFIIIIKETPTQMFSFEYCEMFLRSPILKNICEWLFLLQQRGI